ncbi:MAG: carboxypeptidase-like regulatory domain-containing protein, partial [Myxococcota bacterium]
MSAWLARIVPWVALCGVLLFAGTLSDIPWRGAAPVAPTTAPAEEARLRLALVDGEGAAIEGGTATLYRRDAAGEVDGWPLAADPTAVPAGVGWVVVRAEGYARASLRVVIRPGTDHEITITLVPPERFEVVVVDPLGKPTPGARVLLHSSDPLPFAATTDADGLARFEAIPPGPYAVEASAHGYDTAFLETANLEDAPVFLRLERLAGLEVTVVQSL